jgi:hypothetical protein
MKALWQLSHTDLERSSPDFVAEYRRTASTARLVLAREGVRERAGSASLPGRLEPGELREEAIAGDEVGVNREFE